MADLKNNAPLVAGLVVAAGLGLWYFASGDVQSTSEVGGEIVHEAQRDDVSLRLEEDNQARELIVDKELESVKAMLIQIQKSQVETRDFTKKLVLDVDQKYSRQMQELTDEVLSTVQSSVETNYLNDRDGGLGGRISDDVLFDDDLEFGDLDAGNTDGIRGDLVERKQPNNPYGEGYIVLDFGGEFNTQSTERSVTDEDYELSDIPNSIEQSLTTVGNDIGDNMAVSSASIKGDVYTPEVREVAYEVPKLEKYEIPAFSFAKTTTLHGVQCPIGAQSVGASSGVPARPVVIPVRGIFKGPNGAERDIGTAHLYGFCSGFRTSDAKVGRIEIKVIKMSYWDEIGGSQFIDTSGYIVDETYNQEIKGEIDQAKMSVLGKQSFAAAMVAVNSNLSKAEFTNVATDQGSQSVLTGNALKAGAAQGVSSAFTQIAKFFNEQASSSVDTVKLKGGLALRFVNDLPLVVHKGSDPIEDHSKQYWDILI